MGSLDILVNNAGVTGDNLLMRLSDQEWDRVVDTNLKGAFHTIRAASRGHDAAPGGADHQYHERRRSDGQQGAGELRGVEGGPDRADEIRREGAGVAQHSVQRHGAGYIETEMTAELGEQVKDSLLGRSRWGGWAAAKILRRWCGFWPDPAQPILPGRSSWSMAAW
jgi:3-oxoacyl-[acyl-carrier protein] reductase